MIKTARSFKSISLSLLSSVLLFTSAATPALAENWTLNGSNIYNNNSGNVGVGTSTPGFKLDVVGTSKTSGAVGINGLNPGAIVGGQATGLAVSGYTGLGGLRLNGADTNNTIYQETGNLGITTSLGGIVLGDTYGTVMVVKNGKVAIGNGASTSYGNLTVRNDSTGSVSPTLLLLNSSGGVGTGGALDFGTYGTGQYPGARVRAMDQGVYGANLTFWTKPNGADTNALVQRMTITENGYVGIGTSSPNYKLSVMGTAYIMDTLSVGGPTSLTANGNKVSSGVISTNGAKTLDVSIVGRSAVPTVVVSRYDGGTGVMNISEIKVSGTTTTGFTIKFNVNSLTTAGTVQFNWVAL